MKPSTVTLGIFTFIMAAAVSAQTPPQKTANAKPAAAKATKAKAPAAKPAAAKPVTAKTDAKADPLSRAQDRAVENYKRNQQRAAALEKQRAAKAAAVRAQAAQRRSQAIVVSPAEDAKRQAVALARAQDHAVMNYRRNMGLPVAEAPPRLAMRRENLTCFTGTEDRHARIGVEVVNNQVTYFAYYSKWKPRTCSIEARRDGPYSTWVDNGSSSTIRLVDDKGTLRIERKGNAYRFAFVDVDRMRYCGMDGKLNGSLVVTRGKRSCDLQGVMEGHAL